MTNSTDRDVGNQSISKSYKGILRIANISEIVLDDDSKEFDGNPTYFGTPSSLVSINGYQSPLKGLNGDLKRYLSDDEFFNKTLPTTDSMGHFINWSLGENQLTIGNSTISSEIDDNWILKSDFIISGLEGKTCIETLSDDLSSAPSINIQELALEQYYDHSSEDGSTSYKENDTPIYTVFKEITQDTTSNTNIIAFSQENFSEGKTLSDGTTGKSTATASNINLDQYVKDKVDIQRNNITEVPTGTISWQFCSLPKWYGFKIASKSSSLMEPYTKDEDNDYITGHSGGEDIWQGNRPYMEFENKDNYKFKHMTIQGVCKDVNHLYALRSDNTYYQAKEIIPIYKRDYTLCDGSEHSYCLSTGVVTNFETSSSLLSSYALQKDRFFDLFFTIGYHYTKDTLPAKNDTYQYPETHFLRRKQRKWNKEEGCYEYISSSTDIIDSNVTRIIGKYYTNVVSTDSYVDRYMLAGIDYVVTMAFYKLLNAFKDDINNDTSIVCETQNNKKKFNKKKALDWLKGQNFDEEYVFNTFIGEDLSDVDSYTTVTLQVDTKKLATLTTKNTVEGSLIIGTIQPTTIIVDVHKDSTEQLTVSKTNGDIVQKFGYVFAGSGTVSSDNTVFTIHMTKGIDSETLTQIESNFNKLSSNPTYFEYNNGKESNGKINVLLGLEVNSFSSPMKYFSSTDRDDNKTQICIALPYQFAEITDILDAMSTLNGDLYNNFYFWNQYFCENYIFRFQVPNLMDNYMGGYIGTNCRIWADDEFNKPITTSSWRSYMSYTNIPHRHAIAYGSLHQKEVFFQRSFDSDSTFSPMMGGTPSNNMVLAAGFRGSDFERGYNLGEIDTNDTTISIEERDEKRLNVQFNVLVGNGGKDDITPGLSTNNSDLRFINLEPSRGASSIPCAYYTPTANCTGTSFPKQTLFKYTTRNNYTNTFAPQSTQMLPLIHL